MRQGLRGEKSAAGLKNTTLRGLEEIWALLGAAASLSCRIEWHSCENTTGLRPTHTGS